MLLELKKMGNEYLDYLPAYWQISEDYQPAVLRHLKGVLYGVLFTLFGVIVLSFDSVQPKPGTTIIRDKIFGIEQRYFLIYFNGLLFYLCWILFMGEDEIPT